jgi:hypothetical protein
MFAIDRYSRIVVVQSAPNLRPDTELSLRETVDALHFEETTTFHAGTHNELLRTIAIQLYRKDQKLTGLMKFRSPDGKESTAWTIEAACKSVPLPR